MSTARYIVGDTRRVLPTLDDGSIDLLLTSSPFHRQRHYCGADGEIGLEATPGEFLDSLLDVVELARPKLAPHASLVWELGDTMAGSGGSGGDYAEGGMREGQAKWQGTARAASEAGAAIPWKDARIGFPLAKSHELIPELFRIALAYGRNPLTGREVDRWIVRNVRPWVRTSPGVGQMWDSFRVAHSYMVVACTSPRRWFDLDAVRTTPKDGYLLPNRTVPLLREGAPGQPGQVMNPLVDGGRVNANPAGAPPLDWYLYNPSGYQGAHFATWDPEMLAEPIESMCPRRVCVACGQPSWRITRRVSAQLRHRRNRGASGEATTEAPDVSRYETLGWSCCGCGASCTATNETAVAEPGWRWSLGPWNAKGKGVVEVGNCDESHWRRGVVLDPFGGTFATGVAALGHGRDAIGIDIDPRNADLASPARRHVPHRRAPPLREGSVLMATSSIEWTDDTWNPVTGCDRVSPGCDHCYAMTLAKRLKAMGQPKYQADGDPSTSGPGFGLTLHPDALDAPLRWRKPKQVFVNSMSDLFHQEVPDTFIGSVWNTMALAGHHQFQVLTKRPQRMARLLTDWETAGWLWRRHDLMWCGPVDGPLPNVWLGTSIENDRYAFRADHLRATPAAVRFLSLEPLLGPLPSLDLTGIDQVIVGAESGHGARHMDENWVRDIRDYAVSAGVAFFYKQNANSAGRKIPLPELDGTVWAQLPGQGGRQ